MKSFLSKAKGFSLLALVLAGSFACGVSGSDTGRLALSLTDAPSDHYQAVYVTIREIAVHSEDDMEGSWTVIAQPNRTYDLLALANGVRERLALADLSAGHYTQLRLVIGDAAELGANIFGQTHPYPNYVIDDEDGIHPLKVPSGFQTGVKLVHGFDINENGTTELTLDFDASRSVVVAGRSGQYLLKPTVQVVADSMASIINGTVTKSADQAAIEGALVSAQTYDATAADPKDQVVVRTSSLSDMAGAYKLFLAAGTYNLVASKQGFAPLPASVAAEAGMTYTQDFALAAAETGTVSGTVYIGGASDETFATLSFRQTVTIGTTEVKIEIASVSVLRGQPYNVVLPVGAYSVVASSVGKMTQAAAVTVTKDAVTAHDVTF